MKKLLLLLTLMLALPMGLLAQGSTWQSATLINQGDSGSGILDNDNSDAWFKIEVPEEGRVDLTLTPNGSLNVNYVDFCWKNGNEMNVRQNMYPGTSQRTLSVTNAGKGTYYVHVKRNSGEGSFTLAYQFTACTYANDEEPNDNGGQGTMLESGKTIQGRLGFTDASNYRDIDDWYQLEVTQDGTMQLVIDPNQDYGLSINYMDFCWKNKDGQYQMRNNIFPGTAKRTFEVTNVGKGTYYLHIRHASGHGGYNLTYNFLPNTYANDAEPNDNGGQGTMLESGKTVQGHLGYLEGDDYRDDNDWYKLEVTQDGTVQLIIDPSQDFGLNINYMDFCWKNQDGNYQMRQNIFPGTSKRTLEVKDAGKGTYYVHINRSGGHGGYNLTYNFLPNKYGNDLADNDEGGKGDFIAPGQTVQGHLGYLEGDNYRDNNDWYQLEVPQDGIVQLTIDPNQDFGLNINYMDFCWKNQDGNYQMRQNIFPGTSKRTLEVKDAGKGTYYVHINRSGGHGGYKLSYTFQPNSYRNDPEPNDAIEQATPISKDERKTGHLGFLNDKNERDDHDWYRLETKNVSIMLVTTFEKDTTSNLSINYIDLVRKKGDNTTVVKNAFPGTKPSTTLSIDNLEDDAEYYVHIARSSGTGGYTLSYGAPERFDGSEIRVSCIGRGTTRLGIPSPMEVKVENIGSGHTGSFFLALPVSPDIQILYAELPDENGVKQRVDHDEFAIYDPDEGDCAAFIMSDLGPYESCQFTICTQGIVPNGSRGDSPLREFSLKDKAAAFFGALKSTTEEVLDNQYFRIMTEDGVTHLTTSVLINEGIMTEKDNEQWGKMFGRVPQELQFGYKQPTPHTVKGYAERVANVLIDKVPGVQLVKVLHDVPHGIITALRRKLWLWIYKDLGYIQDDPQIMDGRQGVNGIVRSWDPNEMVGPLGYGDKNYIGDVRTMDYRIFFENKAEATDNAYRIVIDDQLDDNIFDVSTVRFGQTSHEGTEYNWKMSRNGNQLRWEIEGIELPPNVNAPEGEGYVSFSVDLKPNLKNGTQVKNKAAIRFDYNDVIETNEYVNTLDLVAPTTTMWSSAWQDGVATVTCHGNDEGSGISHYLFYASAGGDDYKYIGQNTEPSIDFKVNAGTDCSVYAVAIDHVGNVQKSAPQAINFNATGITTLQYLPTTFTIYRVNGTVVATGQGTPDMNLPAGIYLIRQGNTIRKVLVP